MAEYQRLVNYAEFFKKSEILNPLPVMASGLNIKTTLMDGISMFQRFPAMKMPMMKQNPGLSISKQRKKLKI